MATNNNIKTIKLQKQLIKPVLYGVCWSRNFRQFVHRVAVFTAHSEQQCWYHFSIGVYGSKTNFSLPFFKILVVATNSKREKVLFRPIYPRYDLYCLLRSTVHKKGPENRFCPIGSNA